MLNEKDLKQLEELGITEQELTTQIQRFKEDFPSVRLNRPATTADGILKLKKEEIEQYINIYDNSDAYRIKFVPASGAATRMFKFLYEFFSESEKGNGVSMDIPVALFFERLEEFPFFGDLKTVLQENGLSYSNLKQKKDYHTLLKFILFENGLNYGNKPKGLIKFHSYGSQERTALEEHLAEGALYATNPDDTVKIHLTVSPEHETAFRKLISDKKDSYQDLYKVNFEISYSHQKPSTDMVAVDLENEIFRLQDGSMLFRPGGHGALLENLNDLDADIIFIKNIDNVVPDSLKETTVKYKKLIAGVLLDAQKKVFGFLNKLDAGNLSREDLEEIVAYSRKHLNIQIPDDLLKHHDNRIVTDLLHILNRPIRVCGMVKNQGEPGGGPFWVEEQTGNVHLQIVEKSQIDLQEKSQKRILDKSSHFNPVDLACAIKDYKGEKFDLKEFRDPDTGFISKKSKDGRELKAQELPGLWNGAMAHWITLFVEVPAETFNPVKTINDLLRKEHLNH